MSGVTSHTKTASPQCIYRIGCVDSALCTEAGHCLDLKCLAAECVKPHLPESVLCKEHLDSLPAPLRGEAPSDEEQSHG